MRTFLIAIVATTALVGCGAEKQASVIPTATASAPAKATPAKVTIKGFEYAPRNLEVEAGAKVTWTDEDAANHTVSFSKGPGELGNVSEGKTVSARFTKPGRYAYVCQYHPNMHGTVTVR